MKICYIASTAIPSRAANSVHIMKMCAAYASLGHTVTLVLPDLKGEAGVDDIYGFYGVKDNFMIRKIAPAIWHTGLAYSGLYLPFFAAMGRPEVVHSRSLAPAWSMSTVYKKPTVFEAHQPISSNRLQQMLFKHMVASRWLRSLVVITHSLAIALKSCIPPAVKVVVASDGVDESWLQCTIPTESARSRLNLEKEKRRIAVYCGNLYPGRGIELILEIAKKVSDHVFLIVGGQSEDISRYENHMRSLTNVKMIGFKPPSDVFLYLIAADILLMPHAGRVEASGGGDISRFTSPMKMFEYMAAGKPILASTLPVLQEVLTDSQNACLLPYDQPEAWIHAIRAIQENTQFAMRLGRRAQSDVAQYTWQMRARKIMEHF